MKVIRPKKAKKRPAKPKPKRRHLLIKKNLQFQFIFVSFFSMLITTLATWVLANWTIHKVLHYNFNSSFSLKYLYEHSFLFVGLVILANSLAVIVTALYFSHNVAGPIYRIERSLLSLIETGRAKPIALRKHDLLKETISILNTYLMKITKSKPRLRKSA